MRGNCGSSEKALRDSRFAVLRSVLFNGVITSGSIAKEPPSRISTVCGRVRDVRGFQCGLFQYSREKELLHLIHFDYTKTLNTLNTLNAQATAKLANDVPEDGLGGQSWSRMSHALLKG